MKIYLTFLFLVLAFQNASAQKKTNWQLLKLSEDDDYLNLRGEGTDRGYSSGLKLEFLYTKNVKPRFPNTLLMQIHENADNLYGLSLTQRMYTPGNIMAKEIQYGERPYAGVTYLTSTLTSSNPNSHEKLTTSVSLGAIGKLSGGEEFQTWIHSVINYDKPKGWDNQITNDIVLNYYINYERMIIHPAPNLEVLGNVQMNAGTIWNNMGLGLKFRAGIFNEYFSNYEKPTYHPTGESNRTKRKFQCFFYMQTVGSAIMDDATLQGGFFTHDTSPYVIARDNLNRFIVQYEYGIVLSNRTFGLSFASKFRTAEFEGDYTQQVGNITLYIGL